VSDPEAAGTGAVGTGAGPAEEQKGVAGTGVAGTGAVGTGAGPAEEQKGAAGTEVGAGTGAAEE